MSADSHKRALKLIRTASKNNDKELRLGDLEWEPETIPAEIARLKSLESLTLYARNLTDLSPLTSLPQLSSLAIGSVRDLDLSPIGEIAGLRNLEVTGDGVSDVEFLKGLTSLEKLLIQGPVKDWSPLSGLSNLQQLDLQSDDQTDIGPLSSLTQLRRLSLTDGDISDLGPLGCLPNLQVLEFYWGYIDNIDALAEVTQLKKLKLYATYEVKDLSPLFGLQSLEELELSDCTGLTDDEIRRFEKALPSCRVC